MQPVSYARHQFTLEIIRHTVRLYLWFMPRRPFVEVISAASPYLQTTKSAKNYEQLQLLGNEAHQEALEY
jgi:hypothetical protein